MVVFIIDGIMWVDIGKWFGESCLVLLVSGEGNAVATYCKAGQVEMPRWGGCSWALVCNTTRVSFPPENMGIFEVCLTD